MVIFHSFLYVYQRVYPPVSLTGVRTSVQMNILKIADQLSERLIHIFERDKAENSIKRWFLMKLLYQRKLVGGLEHEFYFP